MRNLEFCYSPRLGAMEQNSIPHGMTVKERVKIKSAWYDNGESEYYFPFPAWYDNKENTTLLCKKKREKKGLPTAGVI